MKKKKKPMSPVIDWEITRIFRSLHSDEHSSRQATLEAMQARSALRNDPGYIHLQFVKRDEL